MKQRRRISRLRRLPVGALCVAALAAMAFQNPPAAVQPNQPVPISPTDLTPRQPNASVPTTPAKAAIVTIHDEINDITLVSMKRRVEEARTAGATIVVFEMDTPGGLVGSTLEICTFIKNLSDLKTVAWVHPAAYSAGA